MTIVEKATDLEKFTLNDIHIGSMLYEVLVAHVVRVGGLPVFYSDLLKAAKVAFPHDEAMQRAVPIGMGMKLLFVEAFCLANGYPNLACLAVSRKNGRPGDGYTGDWEKDKRDIAAFDWSDAKPALDAFVIAARKAATPRRALSLQAAKECIWSHFVEHRATLYNGKALPELQRDEMTNLVMSGYAPDEAFAMLMEMLKNGPDDELVVQQR